MQVDPLRPVGHIANALSLKKLEPDLSTVLIFRARMPLLKGPGFDKAYGALYFLKWSQMRNYFVNHYISEVRRVKLVKKRPQVSSFTGLFCR